MTTPQEHLNKSTRNPAASSSPLAKHRSRLDLILVVRYEKFLIASAVKLIICNLMLY